MSVSQRIVLDFNQIRGTFCRSLQHQLDVMTLLKGGSEVVTATQAHESRGFLNFSPAHGAELTHEESRNAASEWLYGAFLRDALEHTGQFLIGALLYCEIINLSKIDDIDIEHLDKHMKSTEERIKKHHFPILLRKFEETTNSVLALSNSLLSLNKLRSCLVHRLGYVSEADTNSDQCLRVEWMTLNTVIRGNISGTEIPANAGVTITEESTLVSTVVMQAKDFPFGEKVRLEQLDIFSTIFTLMQFGRQCAESAERYALASGIKSLEPQNGH